MKKVSDIGEKRKPSAPCQFCGKVPACPDWTCKRIASVTVDEAGWQVEFVDSFEITFTPEPPDPAA